MDLATEPEVSPIEKLLFVIKCESLKHGYDPETDTNWCHLPMEMREECIKWMDFETKRRVKNTSFIEKLLVERGKVHFERVQINKTDAKFWFKWEKSKWNSPDFAVKLNDATHPQLLERAAQLLKKGSIGILCSFRTQPWPELERLAPYRITHLDSCVDTDKLGLFLLKNCEKQVEELTSLSDSLRHFRNLSEAPVPKFMEFRIHDVEEDLKAYIEKWFEDDVNVGTKMILNVKKVESTNWLPGSFSDRLIASTENHHRYRTDNAKKELHLKLSSEKDEFGAQICKVEFEMVAAATKK